MHRSLLVVSGLAVAVFALGLLTTSPASAFSEEPISGTTGSGSGGNRFLDPDAVPRLNGAALGEDTSAGGQDSPFSFSVTGPSMQGGASVRDQGSDNSHLYWGNTTNRHETYGRDSTSSRNPYGYPYR